MIKDFKLFILEKIQNKTDAKDLYRYSVQLHTLNHVLKECFHYCLRVYKVNSSRLTSDAL